MGRIALPAQLIHEMSPSSPRPSRTPAPSAVPFQNLRNERIGLLRVDQAACELLHHCEHHIHRPYKQLLLRNIRAESMICLRFLPCLMKQIGELRHAVVILGQCFRTGMFVQYKLIKARVKAQQT